MPKLTIENTSILQAALEGLEAQKARVEDQIRQVRAALGGKSLAAAKPAAEAAPAETGGETRGKRELSAAARARIAAAQKKRWAEYRKNKGQQQ